MIPLRGLLMENNKEIFVGTSEQIKPKGLKLHTDKDKRMKWLNLLTDIGCDTKRNL